MEIGLPSRGKSFLALALLLIFSGQVQARSVALTRCRDPSGTRLGRTSADVLAKALEEHGVEVMGYARYLAEAHSRGVGARAMKRQSIRLLARELGLEGVVTCSVGIRNERFVISFSLFDPDGSPQLKRSFQLEAPKLSRAAADEVAALIDGKLAPSGDGAESIKAAPKEPARETVVRETAKAGTPAPPAVTLADDVRCQDPPEGMLCVPGGPAVIGSDDQTSAEKPRHEVFVPTFYIDTHEVTNARYRKCVKAGFCPRRVWSKKQRGLGNPDQPAAGVRWGMAHAFCVWAGRRLPTEAEWEKAARGGLQARTYPWGESPPTCNRSAYRGCDPAVTRPVGSFEPDSMGIHDMAGNVAEWVRDWAAPCHDGCEKACGRACLGPDPHGPCGGRFRCPGYSKRVVKGGSFSGPADEGRGSWREALNPSSSRPRIGFRCASSTARLTAWPPLALSDPLPEPPDPEPPTAEELRIFADVRDDDDIMKIVECDRPGMATKKCRDPMTYLKSNEERQHLWAPYIRNLGGGYVGIGSTQNYQLMAVARSRWAWLFDYDPKVVRLHYIIRAVVLESETPKEFVAAFLEKNLRRTLRLVRASLEGQPAEQKATARLLAAARNRLYWFYYRDRRPGGGYRRDFGWLRNSRHYKYIRTMFRQGRILIRKGNMLTDVVMPQIATSARKLKIPIRVYYPSNAEEKWSLTGQYKQNVLGLWFDERSMILRTLFSKRWHKREDSYWHYVVHGALAFQHTLLTKGYEYTTWFMEDRLPAGKTYISVIRLPGRTASVAAGRAVVKR